jgi:hypothetical protein
MSNREPKEAVIEFLKKKLPNLTCPLCHTNDFEIQSPGDRLILHELEYRELPTTKLYPGKVAGHAPAVTLTCLNCAHFLFFSWQYILRSIEESGI